MNLKRTVVPEGNLQEEVNISDSPAIWKNLTLAI